MERKNLNINLSSDNIDYEDSFYISALTIIIEAFKMLKSDNRDYCDIDEPEISGEIVRNANLFIQSEKSPFWGYAIHDDPPENSFDRKGKHRKRVDIKIERPQRGKHPAIGFEAKRLKRPRFSVNEYKGSTGLGEFISGNYASESDTAGMLGYVQSDNCDYWAKEVSFALNKDKRQMYLLREGDWRKSRFENINNCYETKHNRPTVKRIILIYHLLLDFTK